MALPGKRGGNIRERKERERERGEMMGMKIKPKNSSSSDSNVEWACCLVSFPQQHTPPIVVVVVVVVVATKTKIKIFNKKEDFWRDFFLGRQKLVLCCYAIMKTQIISHL